MSGRPIVDAAIVGTTVYVVPVVVSPAEGEPYIAAAKLDLRPKQNPPYEVARVYDDRHLVNTNNLDNPNLSGLREIEVDEANNVYILNAHSHNESDVLWKYGADGTVQRRILAGKKGQPTVSDPIGLCVCSSQKRVYVATGQIDPKDPNSRVYGFSTEDPNLSLARTVIINGMQHVTAMTSEPQTGALWVVGHMVIGTPVPGDPSVTPQCEPYRVRIPVDANEVDADSLADKAGDLALPMSIVWTGQ